MEIIAVGKDSDIQLEKEGDQYWLYIYYKNQHRFETFNSSRKIEIETMLAKLRKQGLKIPKYA